MSEVFPVVKSYSTSPVAKIFNYWKRSFRNLLCPRCTVVTVRLLASRKSLVPIFFKVSVDQLFDNPESGKKKLSFWKKVWKKSWILDPKIYTSPTLTVLTLRRERTTRNINQISVVTPSVYITLPSLCDASIAHYFIFKLQLAPTSIQTKCSTQCCKLSLKSPNCR